MLYLFNNPTHINIGIDLRPLATRFRTGVGEYTLELLNALFSIDLVNHYYLFYHRQPADRAAALPQWTQPNVHLSPTRWPSKLFNISITLTGAPKLDRLIEKSAGVHLDLFFSPNLHFTALSPNVRHILTVHDLTFQLFKNYYTPKQRLWHHLINPKKQCQKAFRVIAPSENTKRDLVDYFQIPPEKIAVLYPGLSSLFTNNDPQLQTTSYKLQARKPYILFLGTIEPRKNILGLISAFEQAYPSFSTPHSLVIAGAPGWKNREVFTRIQASPLKNQIKLIGFVDPTDKTALYGGASLFVYPSFYEGFGFPVLEAMASGVPTITSNRSSLPEVTDNHAYLINPHKTSEIAAGMIELLNSSTLANQLKKSAQIYSKKFDWKIAARQWLDDIAHLSP